MDFDAIAKELNTKYENITIRSIKPSDKEGQYVMEVRPHLAYLEHGRAIPTPAEYANRASASVMYNDALMKMQVDRALTDFSNEKPHNLYELVTKYYWTKDVFGSFIDTLVYFAASGFHNDCPDEDIKAFYDHWCYDVKIRKILDQIFLECFRTGFVRTYRVIGKYEPGISPLPPLKGKGSKGAIPIAYQVLNPLTIEIVGPLWLGQSRVSMKVDENMKQLMEKPEYKLTQEEKTLLTNLPAPIKKAIKEGEDIIFDAAQVGAIDFMKMDYERYPVPLGTRAFYALDYRDALRTADFSAVNSITHEILKVTIGNDEFPVTGPEQLEAVAEMFNTPERAFQVFWNHTLQIERISAENTDKIFGKSKFEQVNRDISGSFGIIRAMVDGIVEGDTNSEAIKLAVKTVLAKLNYARRLVADWLEEEYVYIANVNKFDIIPSVRFDEYELQDTLAIKNYLMGLADRRIVSYKTIQEELGYSSSYEQETMKTEFPDVIAGYLGIKGSPYQGNSGMLGGNQPIQGTPKGTPSTGRPKNQPSRKKPKPATPEGKTKYQIKTGPKRKAASLEDIENLVLNMGSEELENLEQSIKNLKDIKEKEKNGE